MVRFDCYGHEAEGSKWPGYGKDGAAMRPYSRERTSAEACAAGPVTGAYSNYLGTRAFGHAPIGHAATTVDPS
jgi:hypothetical protein